MPRVRLTLIETRLLAHTVVLGLVALACPRLNVAAEERTGAQIYRQQCASCHGVNGEGVADEYPNPLVGDRSVMQLARLIEKTMPKGAPQKCVGSDAEKVAQYIYDAFYSPTAQARNKPPRIDLARLTVRQYRNAVADLVGSFRGDGRWDAQHGLRGEYFKSRRVHGSDRVLERIDPEIRFDFGTDSPIPDKLEAHLFTIRWQGAVLAPETGEYEFIIRTEHAARLWVNNLRRPLIDAWVKSGNDTEHRAPIFLLGGRAYPLRLEFTKALQGVDDANSKTKPPPVKASIALLWKPPQRAAEVVPARNLSPSRLPGTFVVTTPFPPDDRSYGWERGTSISRAWTQATTEAALETAGYIADHLKELAGGEDLPRVRDFCRRFAERAFRQPLSTEQQQFFIERQFEGAGDLQTAVKRVVLLVLKSPRFLYREIGGADPYNVASRISFALWDSLPDAELLKAAAEGRLATREQVAAQATRMLADLRTRAKLRHFFLHWLHVEQVPDVAKDVKHYPGFTEEVASDLRTSLDLLLDEVVWSETSDFRRLLLEDSLYLNGRLARFYGADLPADAPFQKVAFNPQERAGILSHPYLMATFAYTATSSPIHRGVFLARSVLGQSLRPPPEAVAPLAPELHPDLTTRERVVLQTRPQACQTCHAVINPLGFTLEQFDAVGRYRNQENGRPVDPSGEYLTRTGQVVKFHGVRDLANFLVGSEEVHEAFVEQLFHHLVQQPIRAYGPQQITELRRLFVSNGFHIRKLAVEIVAASALKARQEVEP